MKAGKITAYGILILGLLVCGAYEFHVKASSSGQIATSETSGGGKKKVDYSQSSQENVSSKSTEVDDSKSVAKTSTRSIASPSESTANSETTSKTTTPSPPNSPTVVTRGSWFNIPGLINWNHAQYHIERNQRISSPGRPLGTGIVVETVNPPASSSGKGDDKGEETISIDYPVFEIPGIDSSQAIAVDNHGVYFEAFIQK